MDYRYLYQKYKAKYLEAVAGTVLSTPLAATFTKTSDTKPCLVVLDLPPDKLTSAHQMFQSLQKTTASTTGCNPEIPNPEVVSRRYGCFGPKTVTHERGRTKIQQCSFKPDEITLATNLIKDTTELLTSYLGATIHQSGPPTQIKVNGSEPLIESHRYAAHRNCPIPTRPFAWHQDDFGAIDYPTYTIIYYLHKDPDFQGGDFSCAFKPGEVTLSTRDTQSGVVKTDQTITEERISQQVYNVETRSGRVVILCGDLWHIPGKILNSCHGCRDSVVVQVPRLVAEGDRR